MTTTEVSAKPTMADLTKSDRILIFLIAAAILLNYIDRGNIGVAAPLMKEQLGLSATEFGVAVSAFFWVYAPIQIVVGWLCDRFSIYRLFALSMAACAITTLLTSFAAGLASLIALRLMLGLAESIAFPGSSKLIAKHVSANRRGIANAAVGAAFCWGPAVGTYVGGMIMASFGWRAMFVTFGLLTLLWLEPWRRGIRPYTQNVPHVREPGFPILGLIGKRSLWAMSIGHFTTNYVFYFVMTWLPLYLVQSRGFSISSMAMLATMVFIAQGVGALAVGWGSDRIVARGWPEGLVRKYLLVAKDTGIAVAIVGIASASTDASLLFWLIFGGVALGCEGGNVYALSQMFAGSRGTGTWVGLQNAFANLAGVAGPIITGLLVDRAGGYTIAFWVAAAIAGFGAAWWWLALPSVEEISLDRPEHAK